MSAAMPTIPRPDRRRGLLAGFLIALVPLVGLLVLQVVWLQRLSNATALAHRDAFLHFVEAIGMEIQTFYRSTADRCLSVPSSLLDGVGVPEGVARFWAATPREGLKRLFLVDFTREAYGNYYVLDEESSTLRAPPASDESLAMIVACNPFQVLSYWGGRTESPEPVAAERNADYRIVVKPVTDDSSRVVGVAGMILDETYFRGTLVPRIVDRMLVRFFPESPRDHFAVTVRDGAGETAWATTGEAAEAGDVGDEVTAAFPFVFTDWSVTLGTRGRGPEELARESFLFNLALMALLAAALLGGVLFALRAARRAVVLSEMKSDFVSNVSHELRTPLASIRVFGEFLRRGQAHDPDTVRRYGRHIEAESRRLSRLIDNILDFSRIESGRKDYRFVEADLAEVVESTVDTFQVRLAESGFTVEYVPPAEELPPLRIDPDAMGQVLHNLVDNAVKYSGESRLVTVRLEREGDSVVCSVEDRGVGIPSGEQAKVFDRFHRAGSSLTHDVKGSGLGLSIVQHIVAAHGGEVGMESAPGRGTTVRVRLPIAGAGGPEAVTVGSG